MAFYSKYYYEFNDLQKNSFRVDFLEDAASAPVSLELQSNTEPFSVNYPRMTKLSYKKGSGAEINLISRTDRELLDLYTIDKQEVMVKATRNGELIWCGWLDSELYTEPYGYVHNYPVQFSANDGISLLKRLRFVDELEANYTGIMSKWDILKIIIDKIGLPFTEVVLALSTEFTTGYDVSSSNNILKQTYINAENFYDEDGEAQNLDDVLKHILEPYGATFMQSEAKIVIIDINALSKSSVTFKRYNASTFAYIASETTNNTIDISNIGWKSTNQKLDIISGINEQLIRYSPYNLYAKIESKETDESKLYNLGSWVENDGWWKQNASNYDWQPLNNGSFRGSRGEEDEDPDYYVRWTNDNNPNDKYDNSNLQSVAEFKGKTPFIIGKSGKNLKIDFQAYMNTKGGAGENPYDGEPSPYQIDNLQFKLRVSIGSFYYDDGTDTWGTDPNAVVFVNMGEYVTSDTPNIETKADRWLNVRGGGEIIPLEDGINGQLKIEIVSNFRTFDASSSTTYGYTFAHDLWFRELVVDVVDGDSEAEISDDDIEYIGYLNKKFREGGDDIELHCGTNIQNSPVSLGAMLRLSAGKYYFIDEWEREGKQGNIEELLLNTVVSNFEFSTLQLTGVLGNSFNIFNTISDSEFIPDKRFMILGMNINYEDNTASVTLGEIITDNLTIVQV